MKKNFKLLAAFAILGAAVTFTSCKDEEPLPPVVEESNNITSNTTWKKDVVHSIEGRVSVLAGVTLTIEPGTVIKASSGSGANASALVIARGAKIMAEGTATEPIIFTSASDAIVSGEISSPNLSNNVNGLWGGLIILGNAKVSLGSSQIEAAIEGIPGTDLNGKYGGTNDADNSGVLRYVSIRHGGANIGEGNEINGLTLGGVGSGTTIENIEIVANQDDGIEFFGGSVNITNAIVWNNGDDAIDTDQAWSGTLNNVVVVNPGDEGFELDGPEGNYEGSGSTITNATLYAGDASGLIDFDDNTDLNFTNVYFADLKDGQDVEGFVFKDNSSDPEKNDEAGYVNNNNNYVSSNWEATIPAGSVVTDFFPSGVPGVDAMGVDDIVNPVAAGQATVGANTSMFTATWSWTAKDSGKF